MKRITQLAFTAIGLSVVTLAFVLFLQGKPVAGRTLRDTTLAVLQGGNNTIQGSGSYDCSDAQAAAETTTSISQSACNALTTAPAVNTTCVICDGPNDSSKKPTATGSPIVFSNVVDCSKVALGGKSQVFTLGLCEAPVAGAAAACAGAKTNANRVCNAQFYNYTDQPANQISN